MVGELVPASPKTLTVSLSGTSPRRRDWTDYTLSHLVRKVFSEGDEDMTNGVRR